MDRQDRASRWSRPDWILSGVLLLYMTAAARTAISWDSHLYLASAKSLFWPGMERWYHWIREPLFPAEIRLATGLFGSTDLGFVVVQGTLIVTAASVLVNTFFRDRPLVRRVSLVMIVASPVVVGVAGFVGQQGLFLALICLVGAWVHTVSNRAIPSARSFLIATALLGASLSLASVLLLPLALASAGYVWLANRRRPAGSTTGPRLATAPAMALALGAIIALASWWGFKASVVNDEPRAYGYPVWIWEYTEGVHTGPLPIWQKLLALLAIGGEGTIPPTPTAYEIKLYAGLEKPYSDRCGFVSPGGVASEYTAGYLEVTCRPAWANRLNGALAPLGLGGHRIAVFWIVVTAPVAIFFKRFSGLAMAATAFLAPYMVAGLGISRYAIPVYPLGVVAIASAITALWAKVRSMQAPKVS